MKIKLAFILLEPKYQVFLGFLIELITFCNLKA